MDIRDILKSFDQLSEATTTTDKGTVHKAGPGGYGNKHGIEREVDAYGHAVAQRDLDTKGSEPAVKRGKGRPPKNADSSGQVRSYDSSALSKAMGMGKAPKATGKPSVKHSLKEYFDIMDEALSEAGLSVQPLPTTPQQQQQKAVATKPSFLIKDPANPNMPAITTQDPAVVQAAKAGTMTMQKPGAAPTTPGAKPAVGAGSQVAPMEEGGDIGKHNNATTGFDALVRKLTPKYGKESAMKIAGAQLKKMKMHESHGMTEAGSGALDWKSMITPNASVGELRDMFEKYNLPRSIADFLEYAKDARNLGQAMQYFDKKSLEDEDYGRRVDREYGGNVSSGYYQLQDLMSEHMKEAEAPQNFAQSSPLSTANRGVLEGKKTVKKDDRAEKDGKKVTKDLEYDMGHKGKDDAKAEKAGKKVTKDIEYDDKKKKIKEAAKPDFLDLDKDGDKKEPMKQAAKDKKKVKEGMDSKLQAARLRGKSHALAKEAYNCHYDDMEESRCYHEGFKEGLDECYGQMPILGRTAVGEMGPGSEVDTMASYGAHTPELDEMDKTSYMKQQAIKTPGNTFKAFGQTMRDNDVLDEFAFEALDKQLNAILEGKEVSEGMTVSISKGQQGAPDSVSVSAQDGEADQLLSIIKQAGLGLFGGEDKGFNAPEGTAGAHGGISVVDDHDGMMALMKKLSGGAETSSGDFADEEGHSEEGHSHDEEDSCNECGMAYESCGCDHDEPIVDEEESRDQMAYEVAEDNPPDNGSANSTNDEQGNAAANQALATSDAEENADDKEVTVSEESEEECEHCHSTPCKCDDEEKVEEGIYESYANSADDTFEADIEFMTNVITGGLNKKKSTGQTTIPVIAGQTNRMGADGLGKPMKESSDLLTDYRKLSGL